MRVLAAVTTAAAIASASSGALADAPSKAACIDAYKSAQELSRSGALARARAAALVCARDPCPTVLQRDCAEWLTDAEQRMPTITVALRDEDGKDVTAARLVIDGEVAGSRLDGHAIELEPGEHTISVAAAGREPIEQKIVAREREKGREIAFAFPPRPQPTPPRAAPAAESTTPARPLRWPFWTAAGIGAAGFAVFGVFAVSGLGIRSDLDACKPDCAQDRIDHGKTSFLVADVSLGVALVATGVAALLYVTRPTSP